ncbi:MAG: holo-ACP synthase [Oscillospiraceae bacterium]|nr:holo-ACP synthase [Oscillospiraceae bacterium]
MKIFCGTDIIEIDRIKSSIEENGDNFLNKIYTKKEIEYCESKKNAKYQHYSARFAAKEAVFKALSQLLADKYEVSWKDIEIVNLEDGKPIVNLLKKGYNIDYIELSLSHSRDYAVAMALVGINI